MIWCLTRFELHVLMLVRALIGFLRWIICFGEQKRPSPYLNFLCLLCALMHKCLAVLYRNSRPLPLHLTLHSIFSIMEGLSFFGMCIVALWGLNCRILSCLTIYRSSTYFSRKRNPHLCVAHFQFYCHFTKDEVNYRDILAVLVPFKFLLNKMGIIILPLLFN